MSLIDLNKTKEHESLELEQSLLTTTNVQFDYYPINCKDVQKNASGIHAVYRGNANRPNITYSKNDYFRTNYQATDLYICNNLHEGGHTGEMVIKHIPVSGSVTDIYVCFRFQPIDQLPPTSMDMFIQTAPAMNFYDGLNLSPLLGNPSLPIKHQYYETKDARGEKCVVVVIKQPVPISTKIEFPKNVDLFKVNSRAVTVSSAPTPTPTSKKEGFSGSAEDGYKMTLEGNEMECEIIPDGEGDKMDVYQVPMSGSSYIDNKNLNFVMVAFYMIFFFILFIVVYVGVPYVTYDFPEPAIGVILFVSLAVPIILFIFGSLDDNNSQMIISGLAIFLMGMVSIMGILFKHPKIIANIRGSLTK
jgi:hypothetical protein